MRSLLRSPEDRWPVAVILFGVGCSLAAMFLPASAMWALGTLGILLRVLVPIHQHYHSHSATFRSAAINFVYDVLLSIGGGNLTALWKVHHGLGHHVDYLDQRNDLEGNLRFGTEIPFRRLTFTILGDTLSLPDSLKLLRKFPAPVRSRHRRAIYLQLAVQLLCFALLLAVSFERTLCIFVVPNLVLRWAVFWFSYGQHDNVPMTNVYDSSTTKFRFNRVLLNVGLHTAHHEMPGLHWSKLAQRTERIRPLIPASCLEPARKRIK